MRKMAQSGQHTYDNNYYTYKLLAKPQYCHNAYAKSEPVFPVVIMKDEDVSLRQKNVESRTSVLFR